MTQQQLINMVLAYVKQACGPLKMDSQALEIKCVLINGIPHPLGVWYNYDKCCIEIDLRFLIIADELKTPTALRMQTYSAVYEWYIDYNDLISPLLDNVSSSLKNRIRMFLVKHHLWKETYYLTIPKIEEL